MVDTVNEIRFGRHDVKRGDLLRVKPSKPGKHDGFEGKFRYATVDDDGQPETITVIGAPAGRPPASRTYTIERIEWMRQPKGEE